MRLYALSRANRRIIAVSLLVVAAAILALMLWWLASVLFLDQQRRVAELGNRLATLEATSTSTAELRRVWARLERDARLTADMYPPVSSAQAAASVQAAAQRLFADAGATVRSVQALDVMEDGPTRRVGVRLVVAGTTSHINRALQKVSSAQPVLMITGADIASARDTRLEPDWSRPQDLQATLDIYAFARKEQP